MTDDLVRWLEDKGYKNVRVLDDGTIVGTLELMFTRALIVGLDRWGWEHRYCYENRQRADQACLAMKTGDDAPLDGYVAQRHR